jgi:hemoglobin-like flavoprotein
MTQQEIKLVKSSWAHFRHLKAETIADVFYSKLFLDDPSLRKMFPPNMESQYEKLILTLNIVVARLDKLDELTADVIALAVRHKEYGVTPEHYKMVGDALLWTLEKGLGDDWNADTEAAWTTCYTLLAETMINAANSNLALY